MVLPVVLFTSVLPRADDMADSYISISRFSGAGLTVQGEVSIGKNDIDSSEVLDWMGNMAEGTILSVHDDAGNDYQNNTSFNAIAVLTIEASNANGVETRHVKVYSGPTTDSTAGATLVYETGQVNSGFFDASGDRITTWPLTISPNHFIIVENVDDSRAGTNDIRLVSQAGNSNIANVVVERGA